MYFIVLKSLFLILIQSYPFISSLYLMSLILSQSFSFLAPVFSWWRPSMPEAMSSGSSPSLKPKGLWGSASCVTSHEYIQINMVSIVVFPVALGCDGFRGGWLSQLVFPSSHIAVFMCVSLIVWVWNKIVFKWEPLFNKRELWDLFSYNILSVKIPKLELSGTLESINIPSEEVIPIFLHKPATGRLIYYSTNNKQ